MRPGMLRHKGCKVTPLERASSRAGIEATTMLCCKTPQQMLAYYHQKRDTPEVLGIEPLLNAPKSSFEWIRGGGGLPN